MKESELQKDVINYLQNLENLGLLTFQRNNTVGIYDPQKKIFRKLPRGTKRGYPDITVFTDTDTICLELKSINGVQSAYQKWWEKRLKKHNKKYYIVRNLDELEAKLNGE